MNPEVASLAVVALAIEVPIRWGELLFWLGWREAPLASALPRDEKNALGSPVRTCRDAPPLESHGRAGMGRVSFRLFDASQRPARQKLVAAI